MTATIISDPMLVTTTAPSEPQASAAAAKLMPQKTDIEFAKCDCCGLTEECTLDYIKRIRERYLGKWICGLCSEAVKYEMMRTGRLITAEEAIARHMSFCGKFRSAQSPPDPTADFISAARQILRRSLDSPRTIRSMPASPVKDGGETRGPVLGRSGSCFATLSGV